MEKTISENYIVKPVDKALQVLQCLADERRELTLTEVCYKVRLPKTTVFRYLATLRKWGLVAHDAKTDLYRLGVHLRVLAQFVGNDSGLRDAALPVMRSLRDRFNETINLAEIDGQEIVYLDIVESRRSLRMQATIGARDPAYCTAVGKAMLASLPESSWADHLPSTLASRTSLTLTSRTRLQDELKRTALRGYSLDRGENEEGALCIAAPLFGGGGVIAAISLSAPSTRIKRTEEKQIALAVKEAATAISGRLRGCD